MMSQADSDFPRVHPVGSHCLRTAAEVCLLFSPYVAAALIFWSAHSFAPPCVLLSFGFPPSLTFPRLQAGNDTDLLCAPFSPFSLFLGAVLLLRTPEAFTEAPSAPVESSELGRTRACLGEL